MTIRRMSASAFRARHPSCDGYAYSRARSREDPSADIAGQTQQILSTSTRCSRKQVSDKTRSVGDHLLPRYRDFAAMNKVWKLGSCRGRRCARDRRGQACGRRIRVEIQIIAATPIRS